MKALLRRLGFVPVDEMKNAVAAAEREAHLEANRERSRRALAEDELAQVTAELQHTARLIPAPPLSNEEVQVKLSNRLRELGERVPA